MTKDTDRSGNLPQRHYLSSMTPTSDRAKVKMVPCIFICIQTKFTYV
ncbi:hypothetical protein [Chamaesiphon sp. OTE_75_metabat_556]|nr:hypothetical protein [Chamaesiphon sp. OTE_75_metabat_556]